ncbi:MAG: hypothetical protein IJH18_01155 [Bacilli bacterium]|nr:hypothetical protein [Bacilli bacterium]
MPSRMDRYKTSVDSNDNTLSRSRKNKDLYDELANNTKYTNLSDVSKLTAVDVNKAKNSKTRESYQQLKEYNLNASKPKVKKELEEFNYIYQDHENRIYDINSILKEAKKNREKVDELEKKRNLKNDEFNATKGDHKELKEENKKIKSLIDTIATKTLNGELDVKTSTDLLSDIMANDENDKVEAMEDKEKKEKSPDIKETTEDLSISRKIIDKDAINLADTAKALSQEEKKPKKKALEKTIDDLFKDMDKSFYTKSMDLSDKDFVRDLQTEKESKHIFIKILLVLMVLIIALTVVYFVVFNGDIDNVMKLIKK